MSHSFEDLQGTIQEFCEQREWDQFHGPKDLAIGAVTEASELLEIFRFKNPDQIQAMMSDPGERMKMGDELADVLFFLLRFSQRFDFDLEKCFEQKMLKNKKRYPVESFRGKNHKATR